MIQDSFGIISVSHTRSDSLSAWSFHSVKGGVGKSTLALHVARHLAERNRVALIDMDLTGTSLADVLDLHAPYWEVEGNRLPLEQKPARWAPPLVGLRARGNTSESIACGVPFLNDWFLHPRDVDYKRKDIDVEAMVWKERLPSPSSENLWILPSSAFPDDIARVLPLLYDEPFAAYVEGRLEWLLDALLRAGVTHVVFDTPPTIPGLSRAVLSIALRLPEHQHMSKDERTPAVLAAANVTWTPWLVTTQDVQDLIAVERWLEAIDPSDLERLGVVMNRCEVSQSQVQEKLERWRNGSDVEESAIATTSRRSSLFEMKAWVTIPQLEDMRAFDVLRGPHAAGSSFGRIKALISRT